MLCWCQAMLIHVNGRALAGFVSSALAVTGAAATVQEHVHKQLRLTSSFARRCHSLPSQTGVGLLSTPQRKYSKATAHCLTRVTVDAQRAASAPFHSTRAGAALPAQGKQPDATDARRRPPPRRAALSQQGGLPRGWSADRRGGSSLMLPACRRGWRVWTFRKARSCPAFLM